MSSPKKELIPATDADTEHLRYFLGAMPFAGDTFAPHCKAVAYEPLPPVNARGGRDCEGWTCVYEAVVQDSEYRAPWWETVQRESVQWKVWEVCGVMAAAVRCGSRG